MDVKAFATVPAMSDLVGQKLYLGRTPGPYVLSTSWRMQWKLSSHFLALRKVTEDRDQHLTFLQ